MSASQASYQAVQNHLLGMLAGADRQRLLPDLEPVSALSQQPIMTAGEPFAWVYFPTGGLYSLLVRDALLIRSEEGPRFRPEKGPRPTWCGYGS